MKKYTAEQIYDAYDQIKLKLSALKREIGEDMFDVTLELKFKRPDGTLVPVKISCNKDVLDVIEKYGACDAEDLAQAKKWIEEDESEERQRQREIEATCQELDEAHEDYARSVQWYQTRRQDILKMFFGDKFNPELLDRIWTSADFERVLKEMETKKEAKEE